MCSGICVTGLLRSVHSNLHNRLLFVSSVYVHSSPDNVSAMLSELCRTKNSSQPFRGNDVSQLWNVFTVQHYVAGGLVASRVRQVQCQRSGAQSKRAKISSHTILIMCGRHCYQGFGCRKKLLVSYLSSASLKWMTIAFILDIVFCLFLSFNWHWFIMVFTIFCDIILVVIFYG